MGVLIANRQACRTLPEEKIQKTARIILNALGCPDGELSLLIADDPVIAVYNQDYLRRQGPTNVIAFPMREGEFSDVTPHLLGDVVISVETAAREGEKMGITFEERFDQLLVHGILHLFGYDHEQDEAEAERMEQKSDALLALIREAAA
ncbi:16S rRNA maturation RNase YbeY [Desulfonema ishimotonii]|uniref:Endoribonuclease YbeY n=1 Tax=Desulfonema ishimotonii TaxID=45657 RepID=A0A401G3A2_9BACT|nr:rRNA maturation RNase YbeY [Desulfonema ishimotonii]GBC63717.1 16S rRNA maturation RNase YbeY [Desulfonema ishimotonii]